MALLFNPIALADDAYTVFKRLSREVQTTVAKGKAVDKSAFAQSVKTLRDTFEHRGQRHLMTYEGANLAEKLAQNERADIASILYGVLIKSNINNPLLVEEFAKKGLALARKTKDPIHIMARLDDLNHLYRTTEYGSKKHFNVLAQEKEILKYILKNYDKAVERYDTISRKALPKERYEFMLCGIRMELAKIVLEKNPLMAITELESAERIIQKYGAGTLASRIQSLLDIAYSRL